MNMLIIGNGFDLAHDRPTTYSDFLQFLNYILLAKDYPGDKSQFEASLNIECQTVKQYILSSFDTRRNPGTEAAWNKNSMIQEIYECLDKNAWYEYFLWIRVNDLAKGKDWVDFESEIQIIVEFFDHYINDLYEYLPPLSEAFPEGTKKINSFWEKLDFSKYNSEKKIKSDRNTYFDFINKTYQDLENLIRCLEIYLDDCVGKMPVTQYYPDIEKFNIDSVLNFNYTTIPTDIYPSLNNIHYIHGRADASRPVAENNMVLGVNEYWDDLGKNSHTNFNCYKKFVQRIIKETGTNYKSVLQIMASDYKDSEHPYAKTKNYSNVYIFGHSLDVTDGDILREVIGTSGVVTTVFYRHRQQKSDQFANLSKMLGQNELLGRVSSMSPTIIFKQQDKMLERPTI